MNYLHYKMKASPQNAIKVTLNHKANIKLLDTVNYYKYCNGKTYQSTGEFIDVSSMQIKVPHKSNWHILIEHGDYYKGLLKALVDVI